MADQLIGRTLGQYRIVELIGHGGMASVYKAYQPSLDRFVALKVLHPGLARDPQFRSYFEHEAGLVAKLSHPNILAIFDFGVERDLCFMVMEYVPAATLAQRLKEKGRFAPQDAAAILKPVAEALDYAHHQGVVHRDVKPSNILLAADRVFLSDFGIARIASGEALTGTGAGTPHYMSPEHLRGEQVDGRSDVYSLGVVLYELLLGRVPYEGNNPWIVAEKHLHEPIPLSDVAGTEIPGSLGRILRRAMAKRPRDRFATTIEMVAALTSVAEELRASGRLPSKTPQRPKFDGGLAAGPIFELRVGTEKSPSPFRLRRVRDPIYEMALSSDHRTLLVASVPRRPDTWLEHIFAAWDLPSGRLLHKRFGSWMITSVAVSPDARHGCVPSLV